mmetsp:Transcript_30800/g.94425  ORF Transcript_30800/g.94425 Transcript_30800/m.94425 type:complete len:231 (-) Transcript_30800:555-1247(-)|eukprot:scaffold266118_cov36-Tisochrysis_lutea.AAC.2
MSTTPPIDYVSIVRKLKCAVDTQIVFIPHFVVQLYRQVEAGSGKANILCVVSAPLKVLEVGNLLGDPRNSHEKEKKNKAHTNPSNRPRYQRRRRGSVESMKTRRSRSYGWSRIVREARGKGGISVRHRYPCRGRAVCTNNERRAGKACDAPANGVFLEIARCTNRRLLPPSRPALGAQLCPWHLWPASQSFSHLYAYLLAWHRTHRSPGSCIVKALPPPWPVRHGSTHFQ